MGTRINLLVKVCILNTWITLFLLSISCFKKELQKWTPHHLIETNIHFALTVLCNPMINSFV